MARPLKLVKPRLLVFNSMAISDHNRADLSVNIERIETVKRMANGTMRKYVVADKRTFSTSWTDLPSDNKFTVDGFAGADSIESFYNTNKGEFNLYVHLDNNTVESYKVMLTDFSKTLGKRAKLFNFYDVDITMEEV